jgi:hypothetical protein
MRRSRWSGSWVRSGDADGLWRVNKTDSDRTRDLGVSPADLPESVAALDADVTPTGGSARRVAALAA